MTSLLTIVLFTCVSLSSAYRFRCFSHCVCDTDERLIDCHSKNLRSFPELVTRSPLHGFTILSMRENCISGPMPSERHLLAAIPGLTHIDLNSNPLDCDELKARNYENIEVQSACVGDLKILTKEKCELRESTATGCGDDLKCHIESGWMRMNSFFTKIFAEIEKHWNENKEKIPGYDQFLKAYKYVVDESPARRIFNNDNNFANKDK